MTDPVMFNVVVEVQRQQGGEELVDEVTCLGHAREADALFYVAEFLRTQADKIDALSRLSEISSAGLAASTGDPT